MEIKWDSSMIVGEENIDQQHKKLFDQIDKLKQAIEDPNLNIGNLREVNHFLYTYFKEHFAYEEEYMAQNNYPDLKKHKEIHQSFIDFYDKFQLELREKMDDKFFSVLDIKELIKKIKVHLTDWLINHIKGTDQNYAKYIKEHSK